MYLSISSLASITTWKLFCSFLCSTMYREWCRTIFLVFSCSGLAVAFSNQLATISGASCGSRIPAMGIQVQKEMFYKFSCEMTVNQQVQVCICFLHCKQIGHTMLLSHPFVSRMSLLLVPSYASLFMQKWYLWVRLWPSICVLIKWSNGVSELCFIHQLDFHWL